MKKVLLGMMLLIVSPFVIFAGSYVLNNFHWVTNDAKTFASVLGAISIVVNWFIGILLIIRGYQEAKTFEGW